MAKKVEKVEDENLEITSTDETQIVEDETQIVEDEAQIVEEDKKSKKSAQKDNKQTENAKSQKAEKPLKKKKEKKEKKSSLLKKMKETTSELKKVSWPSFGKVVKQTGVVILVVTICTLLLFGIDRLFSLVYNVLTK